MAINLAISTGGHKNHHWKHLSDYIILLLIQVNYWYDVINTMMATKEVYNYPFSLDIVSHYNSLQYYQFSVTNVFLKCNPSNKLSLGQNIVRSHINNIKYSVESESL